MAEYISKNEVLNLIEHNDEVCHYVDENCENVVYATAQTICKVVADIPAADVQPVKHGKWIIDIDYYTCSMCNHQYLRDAIERMTIYPRGGIPFYCPCCGADMRGDKE